MKIAIDDGVLSMEGERKQEKANEHGGGGELERQKHRVEFWRALFRAVCTGKHFGSRPFGVEEFR